MFERVNGDDKALIAVNRTDTPQNIDIPKEYEDSERIFSHNETINLQHGLAPYGALVLKKTKK